MSLFSTLPTVVVVVACIPQEPVRIAFEAFVVEDRPEEHIEVVVACGIVDRFPFRDQFRRPPGEFGRRQEA